MTKRFICLLTAMVTVLAPMLCAQEETTKPAEGTLKLSKKSYVLGHGVAYESASDSEEAATVVLSAQPISSEKLKKALPTEKEGGSGEFPQPFLKLVFNKKGELKHWNAVGGGTTVSGSSDGTGRLRSSSSLGWERFQKSTRLPSHQARKRSQHHQNPKYPNLMTQTRNRRQSQPHRA